MGKTKAIFFWMSGIITPSIPEILSKVLLDSGKQDVNLLALPNFQKLCDELTIGKIDELKFCNAICEMTGLKMKPKIFQEKILDAVSLNASVKRIINLLPENYDRWLVVDFPKSWFDHVSQNQAVSASFFQDNIVLLSKSKLMNVIPDVFYHLAYCAHVPLDEGLWIDASAKRTVEALNQGMQAAVFVDPRRLEREFTMRYFVTLPQPVHRPDVSL